MRNNFFRPTLLIILLILSFQCISAEETEKDQSKDSNESVSVQNAINRDQELLKNLMIQSLPPRIPDPDVKDVEFEIGDNPVMGSSSAQLVIVQFSDYTCSHCELYTKNTFPEIEKKYIDTGKLRYVVIDYPLPDDIPAIRASEAVHCASEQGKFLEMHEEVMIEQQAMENINHMALSINLDMKKFNECMDSKRFAGTVNKNISLGDKLGIPSVPGFIIAAFDPGNPQKVKGISYIRGAKSFNDFQQEIDNALMGLTK